MGESELSEGRSVVLESFAGGVVTGDARLAKRFLAALGSARENGSTGLADQEGCMDGHVQINRLQAAAIASRADNFPEFMACCSARKELPLSSMTTF